VNDLYSTRNVVPGSCDCRNDRLVGGNSSSSIAWDVHVGFDRGQLGREFRSTGSGAKNSLQTYAGNQVGDGQGSQVRSVEQSEWGVNGSGQEPAANRADGLARPRLVRQQVRRLGLCGSRGDCELRRRVSWRQSQAGRIPGPGREPRRGACYRSNAQDRDVRQLHGGSESAGCASGINTGAPSPFNRTASWSDSPAPCSQRCVRESGPSILRRWGPNAAAGIALAAPVAGSLHS